MEGMKGGGRVGIGEDEMIDGMQCIDHPHRNNTSGICAFCLQDKLGKLVSSSFPSSFSSSSSSSPPSFRSHTTAASTTSAPPPATTSSSSYSSSLPLSVPPIKKNGGGGDHEYHMQSRLPFLLSKKNKKKPSTNTSSSSSDIIFKRSKSSATPIRDKFVDDEDFSPRKRNGFWSFLYLSAKPSSSSSSSCSKKLEAKSFRDINGSPRISTGKPRDKCLKSNKAYIAI